MSFDSQSVIEPFDYINSEKYSKRQDIFTAATADMKELYRDKEKERREIFQEAAMMADMRQKRSR